MSQRRLAEIAGTQQSSVSEYESRRKSPTLEVVERLLDAADAELVVRPMVFFDYREDPEVGLFAVPDRLWSVPVPDCFARVQVVRQLFGTSTTTRVWDLSDPAQRIAFYELVLVHGPDHMIWTRSTGSCWSRRGRTWSCPRWSGRPGSRRSTPPRASQDRPPRDPGGFSAEVAAEVGIAWPPGTRRRRRRG